MLRRLCCTALVGGFLSVATIGVASSAPVAGATECPSGSWSDTVGRPSEAVPGMSGAAVWRVADTNRFRFRVSEAGTDLARFRGTISTDGVLVATGRHLEGGDLVLQRDGDRLHFALRNRGGVDGFDLSVHCASYVRFNVRMNGTQLSPDQVVIGADSAHPSATPFQIDKVAATP